MFIMANDEEYVNLDHVVKIKMRHKGGERDLYFLEYTIDAGAGAYNLVRGDPMERSACQALLNDIAQATRGPSAHNSFKGAM